MPDDVSSQTSTNFLALLLKRYMTEDAFDVVVIGSGGVGKSCITIRFLKDEFTEEYDPTIGESIKHVSDL